MGEKIWDAHVHLFPEQLFKAIWRWFDDVGWRIPYAGWELDRYVAALRGMGVERAFLLTYAHKPDMSLELNRWVRDVCQRYDCFVPFACIHPRDNNLQRVIATVLDDWGFAGFKLQLAVQQYAADDPAWEPVYQAAAERQKPLIIHAGTAPYSQTDPLLGLDHLEKVMEKRPELKVVIPHLGFYEFDKALSMLARYPNIYLDTSWTLGAGQNDLPAEILVEYMERYPHRFLYGSDFPIIEYQLESGLEALLGLGLTAGTLCRVVHDNARDLAAILGSRTVGS